MDISNDEKCFIMLWEKLEITRLEFELHGITFCVRRILKKWIPLGFPALPKDDFQTNPEARDKRPRADLQEAIYLVCKRSNVFGYKILDKPEIDPEPCLKFLQAFVSLYLNIGFRSVNFEALKIAYKKVFPCGNMRKFDIEDIE